MEACTSVMKILFVHNFHQKFGGDDTVVLNYTEILKRQGHSVKLYQRHNDEIKGFGLFAKIQFLFDIIFSLRTYRELKELFQEFQPDLVFIHGIYPLISPSVYDACKKWNVPMVQMVHDMRFWCPMAWFFRDGKVCTSCAQGNFIHSVVHRCYRGSLMLSFLYASSITLARRRGLFSKIDRFVIPGHHISEYLKDSGVDEGRIAYHPHIVPVSDSSGKRIQTYERNYIAYLGRLSSEKGLLTLFKAADQLPGIQFKIAGTGPMEEELISYVADHKMKNVEFTGFISGCEKDDFLKHAQLLIAPSECYESFGQVVVEAYSMGTPVVVSNHGGLASLVQHSITGWVFDPGDEKGLVTLLESVLNSGELDSVGANAEQFYRDKMAEELLIKDLEQTLEKAARI